MFDPTFFIDDVAVGVRAPEVPDASFDDGANLAGSNAAGLGIGIDAGEVDGTFEQFTLLDQFGNTRQAQISQHIGGSGLGDGSVGTLPDAIIQTGANDVDGDGTIPIVAGGASLVTLLAGWVAVP